MDRIFSIGDIVIGKQEPDLLPARVIGLIKTDCEFHFYEIEFLDKKGRLKTAILPEYRLTFYK